MTDLTHVYLDARQIRVLAHPLRARLLGRLRLDGPATATRLAEVLGTNTGATSYHLRQLADAGLVVEEEGAGRGRERWWRSAHDVTSWQRNSFEGDPDATAASDWLADFQVRSFVDRADAWRRRVPDESAAWRAAAEMSDYYLNLNAAQLTDLMGELDAIIERYRQAVADPAPDARQVLVYLAAMPRVDETDSKAPPALGDAATKAMPRVDETGSKATPAVGDAATKAMPRVDETGSEATPAVGDAASKATPRPDDAGSEATPQADDASAKATPRADGK